MKKGEETNIKGEDSRRRSEGKREQNRERTKN